MRASEARLKLVAFSYSRTAVSFDILQLLQHTLSSDNHIICKAANNKMHIIHSMQFPEITADDGTIIEEE